MPVPWPPMTEALIPWLVPEKPPANPFEATSATCERPQPASAPSELVTPGTARAASSAARARSISTSALGSSGSVMSSAGQSCAISSGSAMPQNGSSGTVRAIATARSTSSSKRLGRAVARRHHRLLPADEDPQPEIMTFGAFKLFSFAEPPSMRQRDALEVYRICGVGAGEARAADQVLQQVDRIVCFSFSHYCSKSHSPEWPTR